MNEFVINVTPSESRIAYLEDGRLTELQIERTENRSLVGNIYKGRVDSVVPGIQAAFIDIGFEKNGFLYVSDIADAAANGELEFDDGTVRAKTRGRRGPRPKIEDILKKNQSIMVQVSKDQLGNKGVRLTNFITFPGRYVVLMPDVKHLGISRKIDTEKERDRLRRMLNGIRPKNTGLILRTAGEGKSKAEFQADVKYLSKLHTKVNSKNKSVKAPALLHDDLGPILRIVRDRFTNDVDKLTVDDEAEYSRILNFLDSFAPNLKKRCKLYRTKRPIFDRFGLEAEIEKAIHRRVFLKSGGHICIDQTEALVAIDVNTGRFTGKGTGKGRLEDTVLKTNLEAAEEIARQARLRDLGGIIVCDFIDMRYERNRDALFKTLQESLKSDRAKTTVSEISELGMIEMTRKRVKNNLVKSLSQPCPYCEGSGMVRSVDTMTFDVLRRLNSLFCTTKEKRVILQLHSDIARRLRNDDKQLLEALAKKFDREVAIESVSDFHIHDLQILSARTRKPLGVKE
jgi:ribonuclease G